MRRVSISKPLPEVLLRVGELRRRFAYQDIMAITKTCHQASINIFGHGHEP